MLRGAWAFIVLLITTPFCAGVAMLVALIRRRPVQLWPAIGWSRAMLWAAGSSVAYRGLDESVAHSPCIFVSNHLSNADIWAVIPALPYETKFIAKASLFKIPLLGWGMASAGFIPIDRHDRRGAIASLQRAADRIAGGDSVIVFPEGTRSLDGRLAPFKKGPFHLAAQARVPIVPVVIRGTWEILPPGSWRVTPGKIVVTFLPAIPAATGAVDDAERLRRLTHERIAEELGADGS